VINWLQTLVRLRQQRIPAVMITVASTVGSTPREPGAKMIVSRDALYGTIGGGNLEYKACQIARSQLDTDEPNQLRRFPLGAGLGQCCGGLVNLMFEPIVETTPWLEMAHEFQSGGEDWLRLVAVNESTEASHSGFLMMAKDRIHNALPEDLVQTRLLDAAGTVLNSENNVGLVQASVGGDCYFIEVSRKIDFQLVVFGAGHVGRAIVRIFQDLPIQIRWVDTRDDQQVSEISDNVEFVCTDTPEAEVDAAASGSYFLVMTHDHALDQKITEQILLRDDFTYFGLIGSESKRRMFETRMRRRGFDQSQFVRMTCPIGIEGIQSKQPAAIAISVAGEIMQLRDRYLSGVSNKAKIQSSTGRAR
jgi:xanthine dehydrogenase accessory factor